jgi:hypothetical protein
MAIFFPNVGADNGLNNIIPVGPTPEPEPEVQPNATVPANNLQNYLRANYEIDRITKQFTNCFSQIIDDAVAFRNRDNIGLEIMRENGRLNITSEKLANAMGNPIIINMQKIEVVTNLVKLIYNITQSYKYIPSYAAEIPRLLESINTIEGRLNDDHFVESLYQPVSERHNVLSGFYGHVSLRGPALMLLNSGLSGQWNVRTHDMSPFLNQIFSNIIESFGTKWTSDIRNNSNYSHLGTEGYYLNLLPSTYTNNVEGSLLFGKPDFRFFIRFFQCFADFIRQLSAINFNVDVQLGGNRIKTKRRQRKNKIIKRRNYKTKKMNYKFKSK